MLARFLLRHPSPAVRLLDLILRLWLGWVLVSNAPVGITVPLESIGLDPASYSFLKSLWDTGYLMHLTKLIELLAGLALVLNAWPGLALLAALPVLVNIVGVTAHFFPGGLVRNGGLLAAALVLLAFRARLFLPLLHETRFKNEVRPLEGKHVFTSP